MIESLFLFPERGWGWTLFAIVKSSAEHWTFNLWNCSKIFVSVVYKWRKSIWCSPEIVDVVVCKVNEAVVVLGWTVWIVVDSCLVLILVAELIKDFKFFCLSSYFHFVIYLIETFLQFLLFLLNVVRDLISEFFDFYLCTLTLASSSAKAVWSIYWFNTISTFWYLRKFLYEWIFQETWII